MWKKFIPLVFVVLIILILTVYRLNIFTIKKVDIESINVSCADQNQLKNSSGLLGQNFFMIDYLKTENILKKKFVCIKSVAVSKILPDKVRLEIQNRQALAVLASLKNEASISATPSAFDVREYELIDNEGVIFGKASNNLNLPQIFVYNSKDNIQSALKILEKLKTLGLEINESSLVDKVFVINASSAVPRISFLLDNNIDIQLASLQLILDKAKIDSGMLEFIDLRFDKPVIKFAPKKKN